jgi:hypothetical protein
MACYGAIDWDAAAKAATDVLSSQLGQVVQSIRLDTAYFPPMQLVGSELEAIATGPAGEPTFNVGALLKPKLTIQLAAGNPIVYAPYGDPGEGSWLPVIAGAGILAYLAYLAGQRSRR